MIPSLTVYNANTGALVGSLRLVNVGNGNVGTFTGVLTVTGSLTSIGVQDFAEAWQSEQSRRSSCLLTERWGSQSAQSLTRRNPRRSATLSPSIPVDRPCSDIHSADCSCCFTLRAGSNESVTH